MKFGRTLREKTLKEWRFYAVDYKALKKILKHDSSNVTKFNSVLEESKSSLSKFYNDKETWARDYMHTLEDRVYQLRDSSSADGNLLTELGRNTNPADDRSLHSNSSSLTDSSLITGVTPKGVMDLDLAVKTQKKEPDLIVDASWLKAEYLRVSKSRHFQHYIYAKKSLSTFARELDLLIEFLDLNNIAFSKILKKFDKVTNSAKREVGMIEIEETLSFLSGRNLRELQERTASLLDEVNSLKPSLPEGWEERKVYTIGCFDLFHRGHQNVLLSLREFGYYIVAGIHDDASYFKLKNKYTIDNLETRMANVKPFVDQLYVIPSTDPLLYIQSVVSQQDIDTGSCCYARGDDMLQFPGREWIESVMPVHFVPRTESCSSTLLRTIYHAEDENLRAKAAFAKTRYDGKPIDEEGNVLNLKV